MSFTPAKIITSSQTDTHENLSKYVTRHLQHQHQKPIAAHNRDAFDQAYQWWQEQGMVKVILDSGCGTGESSRYLAQQYPDHLVIGIDQSAKRLGHRDNQTLTGNCLLLRCECSDFWHLAKAANWQFNLHTVFYPNPYPKAKHLQRRWHANPAFSALLAISQTIELRTNWHIYAKEFAQALHIAQSLDAWHNQASCNEYRPDKTITAFEKKYLQSQHTLWQVIS